jgi:hypothetical protein
MTQEPKAVSKTIKVEPLVLLIDLDGTLQGNISPQLMEYDLINRLNSIITSKSSNIKYSLKNLYSDFTSGLLRPFVQEAFISIKKTHPTIEFYIYTASSDEWAHFILNQITKLFFGKRNIINKPYFTRKHLTEYGIKSISKVRPTIVHNLRKKYPHAKFNQIFLIDNNFVLSPSEMNKLIYCPTYDFKVVINPLRLLTEDVKNKYYNSISEYLLKEPSKNSIELYKKFYKNAFKDLELAEKNNKKYINDNYWQSFALIVNKNKINSPENINKMIIQLQELYMTKNFYSLLNGYVKKYI